MSIDRHQVRIFIAKTIKKIPNWYSDDALELMMMTTAVESDRGRYINQLGGGPALGMMGVEPATMRDNYGSYLYFRDRLRLEIRDACGIAKADEDALEYNMAFNVLMARLKYWRAPGPIPSDLEGKAKYHEKFYNAHEGNYSSTGKKDWEVALAKYKYFCL